MAQDSKLKWSRRAFVQRSGKLGAGLVLAPCVLSLAGCSSAEDGDTSGAHAGSGGGPGSNAGSGAGVGSSGSSGSGGDGGDGASARADGGGEDAASGQPGASALEAGAVLLGLYTGDGEAAAQAAVAELDFAWLRAGDSVLIKVASNSGNPHPAVTSPAGVRGLVAHLKSLGAGRVIVADQAGVEWVRSSAAGRFSSTRERFASNGLGALEDVAELHFFDDQSFDDGYFEATLPDGHHWPRGMRVASIVQEVDHILYMPRLSQHMLAGITLAQKSAIGWLRDDSRHDLHHDAADFYEKYAEVSYVQEIRDRVRLVISVCEKLQLHGGPDAGTVYAMTPTLVLASTSLPNHDAVAESLLVTLGGMVTPDPTGMTYNALFASIANGAFSNGTGVGTGDAGPWISAAPSSSYTPHGFTSGVTQDRAIQRGWALNGGRPDRIAIVQRGSELDAEVRDGMSAHGEGLYAFG